MKYVAITSVIFVCALLHVTEISCQRQPKPRPKAKPNRCTEKAIVTPAVDPNECVSKILPAARATLGDPFSFGSVDDFCLVTGISTPDLIQQNQPQGQGQGGQPAASPGPVYDGTGASQFP